MPFSITFTNAKNQSINLNDEVNTFTLTGVGNDLMASFSFQEYQSPMIPGSLIVGTRVNAREFYLPVHIQDASRDTVMNRVRNMVNILNPMLGEGKLTITNGDVTRVINCRYKSGLESDGTGNEQFTNYVRGVISFYASDPYFYAPSTVQSIVTADYNPPPFFPIFPITFPDPSVFNEVNINNSGQVDSWPVIKFIGQGTNFKVNNSTLNRHIEITSTLLAGEQIIVDARPRTRSVRDLTGANRFSSMTSTSRIFQLAPGNNRLEVSITGSTDDTMVIIEYTPVYLSV